MPRWLLIGLVDKITPDRQLGNLTMPRRSRPKKDSRPTKKKSAAQATTLRVVGGHFRGSKLKYAGDPRVRPMKDRVREALFNLLGPDVAGTFAIDLFGGTGALAIESMSRGSVGAVVIERHLPTAKVIAENIRSLELDEQIELVHGDAFRWSVSEPTLPADIPWVVFISPPYRFFTERTDDVTQLILQLLTAAPLGSLFAVEATKDFEFDQLPLPSYWDIRSYPPAVVGVLAVSDEVRSELLAGSA